MRSSPGTRRTDVRRSRQRKKPKPEWVIRWGRLGGAVFGGVMVLAWVYWLFASGWVDQQVGRAERAWLDHTAESGLALNDIYVTGRGETPASDVLAALAIEKGQPTLDFDPRVARQELETLPWVRVARVERRFPSTVFVSLTEREPIGILQRDGHQSLVDETGTVLTTAHLERWSDLPVMVGEGAPQAASPLIRALAVYPDTYWRVRAMVYISQRRWDLLLDHDVTVHLPEEDVESALARLDRVQKERKVLDGLVKTVDLRLPDRMTLEPVAAARPAPRTPDRKTP